MLYFVWNFLLFLPFQLFLHNKHWKSIFWPVLGDSITQTMIKIYNRCKLTNTFISFSLYLGCQISKLPNLQGSTCSVRRAKLRLAQARRTQRIVSRCGNVTGKLRPNQFQKLMSFCELQLLMESMNRVGRLVILKQDCFRQDSRSLYVEFWFDLI